MTAKKILLTIILVAISTGMSGCMLLLVGSGAAAGVGYIKGDFEVTLDEGLTPVYNASVAALAELGLPVISKSESLLDAQIVSRTSLDKKVKIILKRIDANNTMLSIRIGTFGDESHGRLIYEKIKDHL